MPSGHTYTVPAAQFLSDTYERSRYRVYIDHGPGSLHLYAWFGSAYTAPYSARHLAWIDLVVADPHTRQVH